MFARFSFIRPDERRFTWAAFSALIGIMATHMLLETTRDALFLASIPATRLPFVYIAIAASALIISQTQKRSRAKRGQCSILGGWLMLSALITMGFWVALPHVGPAGLYALYIWSGVFATLVVIHFWTLISDYYSISQARRLYPFIGAGSGLGAIVGTAGARVLVELVEPRHLLLAAAGIIVVTAMGPVPSLHSECEGELKTSDKSAAPSLASVIRELRTSPYPMRIAALVLASTAALTFGDFLFKSIVRQEVAPEDLAVFFSTVYLILNLVSLFVQVVVASFLLRRFSVSVILAILPVLLLGGGALLLAGFSMIGIAMVKGTEGSLRHSLYRTASELLYVPLPERLRAQVKALVDVVSQRGGQALASVAILVMVGLGASKEVLAGVFIGLCLLWLGLAIELKKHYLENFRRTLTDQQTSWGVDFPELDLASLESIIVALNSSNDAQVIAALDILSEDKNAQLIPALLLYHPSSVVVTRTLEIFIASERTDFLPTLDRVLGSAEPSLRAALLLARTTVVVDREFLEAQLSNKCGLCRTIAIIELATHGWIEDSKAQEAFDNALQRSGPAERQTLALAIGRHADKWEQALTTLCDDPDLGVRQAAIGALAKRGDPAFIDTLVHYLPERSLRPCLREALRAFGPIALERLGVLLADQELDVNVRWQLPKAIEMFIGQDATDILLASLSDEPDGVVRYRILRALERMVECDSTLEIDHGIADKVLEELITRAYYYVGLESNVAKASDEYRTEVYGLISKLLLDKQTHAAESILRIIGLRWPQKDFRDILYGALQGNDKATASSMELLAEFLPARLKLPVRGLFEGGEANIRVRSASSFYEHRELSYKDTLRELIASTSTTLKTLSEYHVDELGLSGMEPETTIESVRSPSVANTFHHSLVPTGA
ncbi:MAG: HEAT repeat domain-containing protein [Kofleriaceae bacterium]|nr:HEAT repeat domain-containing protein [Kofleriaceae bacterium]